MAEQKFTQGGTRLTCQACGHIWIEKEIDYVPNKDIARKNWEKRTEGQYWICPNCGKKFYKIDQ